MSEERTYLVWEDGNPDPYPVEATNPATAARMVAEQLYGEEPCEYSEAFQLFVEGNLYEITVEWDPEFYASEVTREHPGEGPGEHECRGITSLKTGARICLTCHDHQRKVREWEEFERDRKGFEDLVKEHLRENRPDFVEWLEGEFERIDAEGGADE